MRILFIISIAVLSTIIACKSDKNTSVPQGVNPAITGIVPATAYANDVVTLKGKRFSKTAEENIIKFAGVNATVLTASDTLLTVRVPEDGGTGIITITMNNKTVKGPVFSYLQRDDNEEPEDEYDYVTSVYSGATGTSGTALGTLTQARYNNPEGIEFDQHGDLIIADRSNQRILRIHNETVSLVAGMGTYGFIDGPVATARFYNPYKLAVDKNNNLIYVGDLTGNRIRKIDLNTQQVNIVAGHATTATTGTGSAGDQGFLDGQSTASRFNNPIDLVVDEDGYVYIVDNNNHAIRKMSPDGYVTTLAGDGTAGYSDGYWPNVKFNKPSGICIDNEGFLLVADRFNNRIRKIDRKTGKTTTIAGTGTAGRTDGPSLMATFNGPFGINVDKNNNIYVADLGSHSIRMIKSNKQVVTIGGKGSTGNTLGGIGVSAFNNPTDMDIDNNGNIYITDMSNARIIKMTPVLKTK